MILSVEEIFEIGVRPLVVEAGVLDGLNETHDVDKVVAFEVADCVSDVGTKHRVVDAGFVDAVNEVFNNISTDVEITVGEITYGFNHFDSITDSDFVGGKVTFKRNVNIRCVQCGLLVV